MPLNYSEANLMTRAGMDLRRKDWPPMEFIRETLPTAHITGYTSVYYQPTQQDQQASDWVIA